MCFLRAALFRRNSDGPHRAIVLWGAIGEPDMILDKIELRGCWLAKAGFCGSRMYEIMQAPWAVTATVTASEVMLAPYVQHWWVSICCQPVWWNLWATCPVCVCWCKDSDHHIHHQRLLPVVSRTFACLWSGLLGSMPLSRLPCWCIP